MERYILMIVSVLAFYLVIKRKGFSIKLALGAIGIEILIFGSLFINDMFSPLMMLEIIPWFFICYTILHFIRFCFEKSFGSLQGMRDIFVKRKKFKESQKVATTNSKVKTYKGAKKK